MRITTSLALTLSAISAASAAPIVHEGLLGGVVDAVEPVTAGVGRLLGGILGVHGDGRAHYPGIGVPGHAIHDHYDLHGPIGGYRGIEGHGHRGIEHGHRGEFREGGRHGLPEYRGYVGSMTSTYS
ncbi:hypothetical protein H4R22_005306, partial [Coemansia sp. RSA 1290]